MTSLHHRAGVAVTVGGLLATIALLSFSTAEGQVGVKKAAFNKAMAMAAQPGVGAPVNPQGDVNSSQFSALKLNENPENRQLINAARDCIKDKVWDDAVTILQAMLDKKEDSYARIVQRDKNGSISERWTSVKFEANNLLGSMPAEGLEVYELRFGPKSRNLLDEAKRTGNKEKLAEVAQSYLHTKVGPEANDLLATYFLDRSQFFMAALRYEKLLALTEERSKLSDITLFKAALAFHRVGDMKNSDIAFERLQTRLRGNGLKVHDQVIPLEQLKTVLAEVARPESANPHDWPLIRGNSTNTGQPVGSPPLLGDVVWKRPTLRDKSDESGEPDEHGQEATVHLKTALDLIRAGNQFPVMSGFFPVATGGKLVYRTYHGLTAVNLHDVKDEKGAVVAKAGSIEWKSMPFRGSLAVSLGNPQIRGSLENWLGRFRSVPGFISLVYENSLVGTQSTDGRLVYAVDDLAVPVPREILQQMEQPFMQPQNQLPESVRKYVYTNSLQAYELASGKSTWQLGLGDTRAKDDFSDSLFLGPPLPIAGKLYILNEKKNGELCLATIDPQSGAVIPPLQTLGTVDQSSRMTHDPVRRTSAVHLAYGEGILVCPTHAGEILGIDLLSRTLAWAYPYREKTTDVQPVNNPFGRFPGNMPITLTPALWKAAPPAIADGKVVFTAPDAHSLHCINLRDGTPVWKCPQREGDLFFAGVIDHKVLLVGKNSIRALDVATGNPLWSYITGSMPSGQGVASKNIYYLPLTSGTVIAIDMERGFIKAQIRPDAPGKTPPGNLVFYEGSVLSQTPEEIVAYRQLAAELEVANRALEKNKEDLKLIARVAELRLADGQVHAAVEDLRGVLAKKPADAGLLSHVRQRLYEGMTDLFHADFNTASAKYLEEYRDLCKVPANNTEEQERYAKFYRLVAQGRENQGNLVDAFVAYREFGSLPIYQLNGVPSADDPNRRIPTQMWLRGKISSMFARATKENQKPLEDKIADEWRAVRDSKQPDAIRSFVAMFDVPFAVGREARLHLAESIIEKNDRNGFLEAELCLEQLQVGDLRGKAEAGGRALESLARLEIRKGTAASMQQAASRYQLLGDLFADTVVAHNKTGKVLFNELAADKRFLPYLGRSGSIWGQSRMVARELPADTLRVDMRAGILYPENEPDPLGAQQRIVLDITNRNDPALHLVDLANNKIRWTHRLGMVQINYNFFNFFEQQLTNFRPTTRFRFCMMKGHLAVVQVGATVYAIDMDNPRKLWEHNLMDALPPNTQVQQLLMTPDGDLELVMWNQMGGGPRRSRLGSIAAVQASYVALVKNQTLLVMEPLSGNLLWSKSDIGDNIKVFGDEQNIYLVENPGQTRALRVSDATMVEVPQFAQVYRERQRILGSQIFTTQTSPAGLDLTLYDIPSGKHVWTKTYNVGATLLRTEEPHLTGVIEPDGMLSVVDLRTTKEIFRTSLLQSSRFGKEELKGLREPLLLADDDHYYVFLNQPPDAKIGGGVVQSNIANGLRCATVNGWICAYHRRDGQRTAGNGTLRQWKAGEMSWHSTVPVMNQLILLEQFRSLPIMLLSARYAESLPGQPVGQRHVAVTQSIHKANGKFVYDPVEPRLTNGAAPQFARFLVDPAAGTINLVGYTSTIQHALDDGRTLPQVNVLPPANPPGVQPLAPQVPRPVPAIGVRGNFRGIGLPRPVPQPAPLPAPAPQQ